MQDFRDFLGNYLGLIYSIIWDSGMSVVTMKPEVESIIF